MTTTQTEAELPTLLPCRKCGSTDIDHWHGLGTQAAMSCNECGCGESVQVSDILSYEERYSGQHDFDMAAATYPPATVERARQELFKEWNRSAPAAPAGGGVEEAELARLLAEAIGWHPESDAAIRTARRLMPLLLPHLQPHAAASGVEVLADRVRCLEKALQRILEEEARADAMTVGVHLHHAAIIARKALGKEPSHD